MILIPLPGRRIRLLTVGYGLLIFSWLSPEENQVWPVVLLGSGLALLGVVLTVMNKLGGRTIPVSYILPGAAILGVITGLGASITTTGLMFFKDALHAHLFPDFPPLMMLAILQRSPVWAVAGGLAGAGVAFLWLARLYVNPRTEM
jgi:hypothetical protein